MPSAIPFPAVPRQRTVGVIGFRPMCFPVARTIGEEPGDGYLHLVDGDGASLCEKFTEQQLGWLHVSWCDVVVPARCRACAVLGSWSGQP